MMHLLAELDDAAEAARFTATRIGPPAPALEVTVDGVGLAGLLPGETGPAVRHLPFEALRGINSGTLMLRADGLPVPPGTLATEGAFFEAIALPDAGRFLEKVQLNHSRYASRLLLELGARCAHGRFRDDALTQAAALTILGHRHIERLSARPGPVEAARIQWLLEQAGPLVAQARARLGPAGIPARPDWRDVRWSVSLATVCGYLHMVRGDDAAAREMFALPRHCLHHVGLSKVSALNMVVGCFLHGVLSHMLDEPEAARDSLLAGIEGVKPAVQAQDLTANVWVVGDLINVLRVARQCFIARTRLGLAPAAGAEPMLDAGSVLTLAEVAGPLPGLVQQGLVPRLQAHILRHGGR